MVSSSRLLAMLLSSTTLMQQVCKRLVSRYGSMAEFFRLCKFSCIDSSSFQTNDHAAATAQQSLLA